MNARTKIKIDRKTRFVVDKNTIISIVILFVVGLIVYLFNYLTPMYADDYAYSCIFGSKGVRVKTLIDVFQSQREHYFSVNGRTVTHFLAQVFLLIGKPVFNLVNTLSFLSLGLVIYYHVYLSLQKIRPFSLSIIYFCLFFFTPDFGQSFLWITGSANYLYGPLITLLFLLPYRKTIDEMPVQGMKSILLAVSMFLLGLLAGNVNENNGTVAVFVAFCFCCYQIVKHKKFSIWHISSLLGSFVGCAFMLLSPGTKSRVGEYGFDLSHIHIRIILMTSNLMERYGALILLSITLLVLLIAYLKKSKRVSFSKILVAIKMPLIYLLLFLISFFVLAVPPYFDLRVWSTFTVFLIILVMLLFAKVEEYILNLHSLAKVVIAVCATIMIVGVAYNNYPELSRINTENKNRISVITQAHNDNQREVSIPAITSSSKFSCFGVDGDIMMDSSAWQNILMARYYGMDSIRGLMND